MPNHIALTYKCNVKCPFCYADEFQGEMSIEDFKKVLNWFKKQNIRKISLIGGEPTIHKDFKEIINILKEEKFTVTYITNGTFDKETSELMNFNPKNNFFINISIPKTFQKIYEKNIDCNLRNIKNATVRYNIIDYDEDYKKVIDLCKKYNKKRISYALIAPNMNKKNKYIAIKETKKFIPLLTNFIKDCKKENIKTEMARPLPMCLFNKEEKEFLQKNGNLYFDCNPSKQVIVINPDLSVFPCVSVNIKGPNLLTFKNFKEFHQYYKKTIDNLKFKNYLFPECKTCIYNKRRQCCGGCLNYKEYNAPEFHKNC